MSNFTGMKGSQWSRFAILSPVTHLTLPQRSALQKQPTAFKHCKHDLDDGVKHCFECSPLTRGHDPILIRIFFKRVAQPLGSDPICRLSSVPRKELRKTCGLKEIPVNDGLQAWFRCLFFGWGGVGCNDVSDVKKRPGH